MARIITFGSRDYGIIKDDYGSTIATLRIKKAANEFVWKNNKYIVVRKKSHRDYIEGWFFDKTRYFYNVNNPFPLSYDNKHECFTPILEPELLNRFNEASILIKLNSLSNSWLKNITFTHVVIGIVFLVLVGLAVSNFMGQ